MKLILYQETLAIIEIDFVPGPFRFHGPEDELCVKVQSKKIDMNEAFAARFLSEAISLKEKDIDGTYSSNA